MNKYLHWLLVMIILTSCAPIQEVHPGTLRVGVITPLTGSQAIYGQWTQNGVTLASENQTAITVFYEDSQCDGKTGLSAFNKLVEVNDVGAIISGDCATPTLSYITLAEEKGIPLIVTAAGAPSIKDAGEYIFRVYPTVKDDAAALAVFANNKGWRTAAFLYAKSATGAAYAAEFERSFSGNVIAKESYEMTDTDFRTQLSKIKNAAPESLFIYASGDIAIMILQQADKLGISTSILVPGPGITQKALDTLGQTADGIFGSFPVFDAGSWKLADDFKGEYKARFGEDPSYFAAMSYDALTLFSNAQRACGQNTSCIKDQLSQIKNYTGVSQPISFDENGEILDPHFDIKKVKNGKFIRLK